MAKPPPSAEEALDKSLQAQEMRRISGSGWGGRCETALTMSARRGHADLCRLLLVWKANTHVRDGDGDSLLCVAARAGHSEVCQALLDIADGPEELQRALEVAD